MKFLIALTVISVVACVTAQDFAPDGAAAAATSVNNVSCTTAVQKALIEKGKVIYQKYLDGPHLLANGDPDVENAPQDLQDATDDFADEVDAAFCDPDAIEAEIIKTFQ